MSYLIQDTSLQEIYFGPQGFHLFTSQSEQEAAQAQFSQPGEQDLWNQKWLVVGLDTELGDPYVAIIDNKEAGISTAIFTGEEWELIPVASSFENFLMCLSHIRQLSNQLEPTFVPDEKSVQSVPEIIALEKKLSATSGQPEFWEQFISCYQDWLKD